MWSLLHLTGVRAVDPDYEVLGRAAVTLEDLKTFRQLGSRCPGHPEYRWTSGVETTTGPLGHGVATSVGMAMAGQWLAARYNRDGFPLFDFSVYALAGDGCMMEGISSEAASLAAHQGLSNLCWIYDSNRVTIEGHTGITFTEDGPPALSSCWLLFSSGTGPFMVHWSSQRPASMRVAAGAGPSIADHPAGAVWRCSASGARSCASSMSGSGPGRHPRCLRFATAAA